MARALQFGPDVTQRGFTLIEILVAVALIGVLAAVAVMSFGKQTRKARGSEVNAMFAALRVAQEQYHLENGTYLSLSAGEGTLHPATPRPQSQALTPMPASWTSARVALPFERGYCGYTVVAGRAGTAVSGTKANEFGLAGSPAADWYYLYAKCDLNGNGARDSHYFSWSGDTRIQKQNEGY